MRFNLIKEPEENPTDLLDSYRQQNILMQKIRILHTAFDGIKLNNWSDSNREMPNILIGSVCEFEGRLFEATDNIILEDNVEENESEIFQNDMRYIKLVIHRDTDNPDDDYLTAEVASGQSEIVGGGFPNYDYENRGFYIKENGKIKEKYLRLSMKYSATLGGYVEKKYWNISDLMRAGIQFKKHSVNLGVGTHEFEVPDSVNTLTVHLVSGGGGGATRTHAGWGQAILNSNGGNGGDSQIIINDKTIVSCGGGKGGKVYSPDSYASNKVITPGAGGIVTYDDMMHNHIQYINGNKGLEGKIYSQTGDNGGALIHNTICFGGNGGGANFYFNNSLNSLNGGAGGGAGSCAVVTVNRNVMQGAKKIKIVVGAGGKCGVAKDETIHTKGENGEDGSAVVEYFLRG